MTEEKKRLLVIDSNSVIHRAYHALPFLTTKKGDSTGAIYGFLLVFLKAIKDFQPDFIAAAFDLPSPTFRHKKYKKYKAKRKKAPEELYRQIPMVKEVLEAFNVPIFEKEGYEADDVIGTIVFWAPKKQIIPKIESIILSGDLDSLQLVDSNTKIYALRKGVKDIILYDENLVREKFRGLSPEQILDFKALRGDASDNIPGVTGIGEKTAIDLLLSFKSLENIYKEIAVDSEKSKNIKPRLKEIILKYKEQAFFSKDLARIDKNVPLDFKLEKCGWGGYGEEKIARIIKKFEFYSLLKRISGLAGSDASSPDLSREINKKENGEKIGENLKLW